MLKVIAAIFVIAVYLAVYIKFLSFIIKFVKKCGKKLKAGSSFFTEGSASGSVSDFTDCGSTGRKNPSDDVWDRASEYYERNAWEAAREEESAAWSSWQDTNSYYDEY